MAKSLFEQLGGTYHEGKESEKILAAIFPEACEEITWKTIYPLKYGDVQLLLLLKTAG